MLEYIKDSIKKSPTEGKVFRMHFWKNLLPKIKCENFCEIGVYRGEFAINALEATESIQKYYMIDPWKHLNNWNKPANTNNETFEKFYKETLSKTESFKEKRIVIRKKTVDAIKEIEDSSLDFVYIDGDHTLRGIMLDIHSIFDKVKENGIIAGDDLCKNIWKHGNNFSPTQVFPYVLYFAELHNLEIFLIPRGQFIMIKKSNEYKVNDLDGYLNLNLKQIYGGF